MSRINTKKTGTKVQNRAGGVGYSLSPKMELVMGVINSFVKDKFYASQDSETERIIALARNTDPLFVNLVTCNISCDSAYQDTPEKAA